MKHNTPATPRNHPIWNGKWLVLQGNDEAVKERCRQYCRSHGQPFLALIDDTTASLPPICKAVIRPMMRLEAAFWRELRQEELSRLWRMLESAEYVERQFFSISPTGCLHQTLDPQDTERVVREVLSIAASAPECGTTLQQNIDTEER